MVHIITLGAANIKKCGTTLDTDGSAWECWGMSPETRV